MIEISTLVKSAEQISFSGIIRPYYSEMRKENSCVCLVNMKVDNQNIDMRFICPEEMKRFCETYGIDYEDQREK